MILKRLQKWWSDYVNNLNQKGIPIPMIRDPRSGVGSVSLTFMWLSGTIVAFGLIGKTSRILGDVDMSQALWFFGVCAGLYCGRKFQKGADGSLSLGDSVEEKIKADVTITSKEG